MTRQNFHHKEGVAWYKVPVPYRWHNCWGQTYGTLRGGAYIRRCPCGAVSVNFHPWTERNTRRRLEDRPLDR